MDSGNSGSLQSSSGGGCDDEFDAACGGGAADSSSPLSALLRHHPGFGGGGSSSLIDGLEELGAPPLSHWCPATAPFPQAVAGAPASPPPLPRSDQAAAATAPQPAAPARGSRKRARASRRAPTTVITTETSNFRAMVQEFTGIPAPPFAGAARSHLDHLFPSRSSSAAAAAALPQYLLRPLANSKLHSYPPPFTSPAPANAAIAASTVTHAGATAVASGDDSYQQHLTTAAPPALLGTQNHGSGSNSYLSFQGALGAQLDGGGANKYPLFDDCGGLAPSSATRPQDPAGFLGLARGSTMNTEGARAHLHPRNSNEVPGLVGGCKAIYSPAPPPLERNGRSPPAGGISTATTTPVAAAATAAMRTRGADSWVCGTSE